MDKSPGTQTQWQPGKVAISNSVCKTKRRQAAPSELVCL